MTTALALYMFFSLLITELVVNIASSSTFTNVKEEKCKTLFFQLFLSNFYFSTLFQQRNILKGGPFPYLIFAQNWIVSDSLQKLLVPFSRNIFLFLSHGFELL